MKCEECDGYGITMNPYASMCGFDEPMECPWCQGKGFTTAEVRAWWVFDRAREAPTPEE